MWWQWVYDFRNKHFFFHFVLISTEVVLLIFLMIDISSPVFSISIVFYGSLVVILNTTFTTHLLGILNSYSPNVTFLYSLKTSENQRFWTPFMNKELQQAIMITSKLRNKFINSRSLRGKNAYNKQRNTCISLEKQRNYIIRSWI